MTTYYVNQETGSDANSGTDPSNAFSSVARVNSLYLQPGDEVLFAKGQVWKETLVPRTSGTEDNPITFGSYGPGNGSGPGQKAVFDGARDLRWSDWDNVGPNQWQTSVPKGGFLDPGKVYVNGDALGGESPNSWSVDSPGEWNWTNGRLTVYGTSSPRGTDIAMQVRDEVIRLDYKDNLVFEDIATKRAFNGITLYEGSDNNTFENVSSHRNTLHGFWIRDSDNVTLDGIRAYDNGQAFTKLTSLRTGEGVWLDSRTDNATIRDSAITGNEQHGVNFSFRTGDGHEIINNKIHSNGEAGLAIAGGNQTVTGNTIYNNNLGGIVATLNAKTMTVEDNVITAPRDLNFHALFARGAGDARFVSEGNKYKGDFGHVVYMHAEAGDNSTFTDDFFVASKTGANKPLIFLDGGTNHTFNDVDIVSKGARGVPIGVFSNSSAEVRDSDIYGQGANLVWDVDGGGYRGINNEYFRADSDNGWITKGGTSFNRSDIDNGRVDFGSSTQFMTPGQLEGGWARGIEPTPSNVSQLEAIAEDIVDEDELAIGKDTTVENRDIQSIDDLPDPIELDDPLYEMTDGGAATLSVLEAVAERNEDFQSSNDDVLA